MYVVGRALSLRVFPSELPNSHWCFCLSFLSFRFVSFQVAGVVRAGESGPIAAGDDEFMKQLRMGKSFLHGTDKDGRGENR